MVFLKDDTVQWWCEYGFLSNTLIALLHSCSMGFRFVAQANDQFVKQYSMWDRIIQWRYDFAALTVKKGLICLKCCKLNLTVLDTFLICFLKVKFESIMTPRYLKWGTSYITLHVMANRNNQLMECRCGNRCI